MLPGALSSEIKRPELAADHSPNKTVDAILLERGIQHAAELSDVVVALYVPGTNLASVTGSLVYSL
jgi:hypothetical protein